MQLNVFEKTATAYGQFWDLPSDMERLLRYLTFRYLEKWRPKTNTKKLHLMTISQVHQHYNWLNRQKFPPRKLNSSLHKNQFSISMYLFKLWEVLCTSWVLSIRWRRSGIHQKIIPVTWHFYLLKVKAETRNKGDQRKQCPRWGPMQRHSQKFCTCTCICVCVPDQPQELCHCRH